MSATPRTDREAHKAVRECNTDGEIRIRAWNLASKLETELFSMTESRNRVVDILREVLDILDDEMGMSSCDCRPEPENSGHICSQCKARNIINELSE